MFCFSFTKKTARGANDFHSHFNSLDKFPNGDYLLSSRHTSTIYKISHDDGSILWRLGGVQSDFDIPADVVFSRQHDARFMAENATHTIISFFDNSVGWDNHPTQDNSRALIIALQPSEKKVELVLKVDQPEKGFSDARGNNHVLPNGNLFVGWSTHTRLSEHSPDGRLLMHANAVPDIATYRSYKFPWIGHPKQPPHVYSTVVNETGTLRTTAYVSWNGATEVGSWKLYKSDAEGRHLTSVNETARRGFETDLAHDGLIEYVVVEALDSNDQSIGRSGVVQTLSLVEEKNCEDGSRGPWSSTLLTNPVSTILAGLVACVTIWAVIRLVRQSSRRSWWLPVGTKHWPASTIEQDSLLRSGDGTDEDEDGMELKDKTYT